jgi:hypothetical protein
MAAIGRTVFISVPWHKTFPLLHSRKYRIQQCLRHTKDPWVFQRSREIATRFTFFRDFKISPGGVFRIPASGRDAERIADLKGVHYTGYYSVWFGLDPTDAPLLLLDVGTSDIYALALEQK